VENAGSSLSTAKKNSKRTCVKGTGYCKRGEEEVGILEEKESLPSSFARPVKNLLIVRWAKHWGGFERLGD